MTHRALYEESSTHTPSSAPRVSVVVPVFNAERTLEVQLDALTRQDFQGAWEVIVADNGSTDRSVEIASSFLDRLPLRIVEAAARRGAAHPRNVGARAARAPLLAFIDADDEATEGWLTAIVGALAQHDAVASRFDSERLNSAIARATRGPIQHEGLGTHHYAHFLPHASASGLAVHRAVHDEIGGFDESLQALEDTDYTWRIQLAGHDLHYEPRAVVNYRFRQTTREAVRQAFLYGRYDGRLYNRYVRHGMERVPLWRDVSLIVRRLVLLAIPPWRSGPKAVRALANRLGVVTGRLESWRAR